MTTQPSKHGLAVTLSAAVALIAAACSSAPVSENVGEEASMLVVSGTGQTGVVETELPQPVVVKVVKNGRPVRSQTVNFVVTTAADITIASDAGVDATTDADVGADAITSPATYQFTADPFYGKVFAGVALTDANGIAQDFWTLGTHANVAQTLEARAVDSVTGKQVFAAFTATALPGPAYSMFGGYRSSLSDAGVGGTLRPGATVVVRDRFGNPVSRVAVAFAVTAGGGACSPTSATTGTDGTAQTDWTLGPNAVTSNVLTATAAGLVGSPQTFYAYVPCATGSVACSVPGDAGSPVCIDVRSDPKNCGYCGRTCGAGLTCAGGNCSCAGSQGEGGTGDGGTGLTYCLDFGDSGSSCVDLQSDPSHCGACFNTCPSNSTCNGGRCTCPTSGQSVCGSACVDVQNDPSNCGSCYHYCGYNETCQGGSCSCRAGLTSCGPDAGGPICVDLQNDSYNCGSCSNACPPGESCQSGTCACPPSTIFCTGSPDAGAAGCVDPNYDPQNCGGCGLACPGGQPYCSAGTCYACASIGWTQCGNACAFLSSDNLNCGSCGIRCGPNSACVNGACVSGM